MRKRWAMALCAPGIVFLILCCIWPVLRIVLQTVYDDTGAVSFAGYISLFQKSYFVNSLRRTLKLAAITTLVCGVVGVPVSFYISRMAEKFIRHPSEVVRVGDVVKVWVVSVDEQKKRIALTMVPGRM